MIYLTLCTLVGIILISCGLLILYRIVMTRFDELEKSLKVFDADITNNKRDIRVLKERAASASDKVVFINTDLPEPKLSYPSKEGL